jgi:hypothetical protein
MPILRDIPIRLTADEILQSGRRGNPMTARSPVVLRAADQAVQIALDVIRPTAVWDEFAITQESERIVALDGPHGRTELAIGKGAALLQEARRIMAAVWTIGADLETRVSELHHEGLALLAFMLDTAGVLALGAVGEAVRGIAEQRASAQGWGVSPALSPGSLPGWPVQGQRKLCALLRLREIGVELSPYYVLQPHKSCSAVVGIGPGYTSAHVGSLCERCALSETCWRRRRDAA